MVTGPKPLISDDLLHQVQEAAREQNREPVEVIEEAVGRYLASQRLARGLRKEPRRGRGQKASGKRMSLGWWMKCAARRKLAAAECSR